jgi:hypothetical protein
MGGQGEVSDISNERIWNGRRGRAIRRSGWARDLCPAPLSVGLGTGVGGMKRKPRARVAGCRVPPGSISCHRRRPWVEATVECCRVRMDLRCGKIILPRITESRFPDGLQIPTGRSVGNGAHKIWFETASLPSAVKIGHFLPSGLRNNL